MKKILKLQTNRVDRAEREVVAAKAKQIEAEQILLKKKQELIDYRNILPQLIDEEYLKTLGRIMKLNGIHMLNHEVNKLKQHENFLFEEMQSAKLNVEKAIELTEEKRKYYREQIKRNEKFSEIVAQQDREAKMVTDAAEEQQLEEAGQSIRKLS